MQIIPGAAVNVDWLYQVRNGRGFTAGTTLGPSPGNYSEIQLLNPAASGKTALVHVVLAAVAVASIIQLNTFDTGLTTDAGAGVNLLLGGAAGVCHIRTDQPAARDGTFVFNYPVAAGIPVPVSNDWYFQLGQGKGFLLCPGIVNVQIGVTFMWAEF